MRHVDRGQLEKGWEGALRRVLACEQRLNAVERAQSSAGPDLAGLAEDLAAARDAPGVTMRARLCRTPRIRSGPAISMNRPLPTGARGSRGGRRSRCSIRVSSRSKALARACLLAVDEQLSPRRTDFKSINSLHGAPTANHATLSAHATGLQMAIYSDTSNFRTF